MTAGVWECIENNVVHLLECDGYLQGPSSTVADHLPTSNPDDVNFDLFSSFPLNKGDDLTTKTFTSNTKNYIK